jgi:hypothetical protein
MGPGAVRTRTRGRPGRAIVTGFCMTWKYELGGTWTEVDDPFGDEWDVMTDEVRAKGGFPFATTLFGPPGDATPFSVELSEGAQEGFHVSPDGRRSPDRSGQWLVEITVISSIHLIVVDDFRALLELLGKLAPLGLASSLTHLDDGSQLSNLIRIWSRVPDATRPRGRG